LLSSWGIKFEPVDVEAKPEAIQELARHGIRAVPAVVVEERAFHGWNPGGLAQFMGIEYAAPERLSPDELAKRLDRILEAAQRAIRQVPPQHLGMTAPDRARTVRDLGYHVFRLSLAYREAMEQGNLPKEWLQEGAPPQIPDGPAIALYGQNVRNRLSEWLGRAEGCRGRVMTYYGSQTAHEMLERTTWHAAQHLRQLYLFLQRMQVTPNRPLTEEDYKGLPLPREVWS
jgi:hypothetical protein